MTMNRRDFMKANAAAAAAAAAGIPLPTSAAGAAPGSGKIRWDKAKIQASNELLHKAIGTIDTPEKFAAKRHELAEHEWARMKANDSQECRNCHNYQYMDLTEQGRRAVNTHSVAFSRGQTCIDCHKGIAHQLPPIEQEIGAPKPVSAKTN